jgi:hypothetical protein
MEWLIKEADRAPGEACLKALFFASTDAKTASPSFP